MKAVVKPQTLDLNTVTPQNSLSDMLIATKLLQVFPNFHGTQKFPQAYFTACCEPDETFAFSPTIFM